MSKNLNVSSLFSSVYSITVGIFFMLFCAAPKFSTIGILLIAGVSIFGLIKKYMKFVWSFPATLFTLFYLVYLIGCFWSDNWDLASKYLEYKLSFIVFPILLSFRLGGSFCKEKFFLFWIIAVSIASFLGISNSFMCSQHGGEDCFQMVQISPIHHPSYFSVFHVLGLTFAWFGFYKKWNMYRLWWVIPFSMFSVFLQYRMLSLAGIFFFMIFSVVVFLWVTKQKIGWKGVLVSLVVSLGIIFLAFAKIPKLNYELKTATGSIEEYIKHPSQYVRNLDPYVYGGKIRLVLWTASSEGILENPLGLGTADSDDFMQERLKEMGQGVLAEQNLNPHNQYLQIGLELGVLGIFFFLFLIGYFVVHSIKTKNYLLLIVTLSLAFNCLFESMLQRQSGVVFYTFWMLILWNFHGGKSQLISESNSI